MGKTHTQTIQLYNPSNYHVQTECVMSNTLNYSLSNKSPVLPPKEVVEIELTYTPTHYLHAEDGDLLITSTEVGDWRYFLSG